VLIDRLCDRGGGWPEEFRHVEHVHAGLKGDRGAGWLYTRREDGILKVEPAILH
jgi:hypothetical protein